MKKDTPYNQDYLRYQLKSGRLRRFFRRFYINNILRYVSGTAMDFGCGTGELLSRLPFGSIGFEINEEAVRYCRDLGLDVRPYDPKIDKYRFSECVEGKYKVFIMSHVLEHTDDPDKILRSILRSCKILGVERIIIVVPGPKGFRSDETHKTFVDADFFEKHNLLNLYGYSIIKKKYFPFNFKSIGNYFTHHELIVVYNRMEVDII